MTHQEVGDWIVGAKEAHQRLGLFLREKFQGRYSAKLLKRWIDGNRCEINGVVERFASRQVLAGDRVVIRVPKEAPIPPKREAEIARILYEDVDILLYNKPMGVTSEALIPMLEKTFGPVQLVHRLDRDTSGVMLFSRNERAKKAIEDLFRQRIVVKTYLAIVDGSPKPSHGVIKNHLGKLHVYEGQAIWGAVAEGKGQYAETAWQCLSYGPEAALVLCHPKTGRTHQIRVHMKELGHSILGDYQYARRPVCEYRPLRPLLHAYKIEFPHPVNKNLLVISAPVPDDFQQALAALQLDMLALGS